MPRNIILLLCAAVTLVFSAACCLLTYYFTKNSRNGEIYVAADEYDRLMDYFELDNIETIIKKEYYTDVQQEDLITGSLEGVVNALGDGYSTFYEEQDYKYFDESAEGSYIGQGMLIDKDAETSYMRIVRVFADSAAYDANLLEGYLITEIDGRDTRKIDAENAVSRLRGQDGVEVALSVKTEDEEREISLVRKSGNVQVVFSNMLSSDIGYIDIVEFSESSLDGFKAALDTLKDEKAKGMVIDIRSNPGGYISQVSEIANMLIEEGDLYYTVDKSGEKFVITAKQGMEFDGPIVVLTNEKTKGVAEVFAAALQDNNRATIVGEPTYGKGVVLSMVKIPNTGDGMRLVTALYYTPLGNPINEVGVLPDYEVKEDGSSTEEDLPLQKAIELLEKNR